jgi:hypothetical protein
MRPFVLIVAATALVAAAPARSAIVLEFDYDSLPDGNLFDGTSIPDVSGGGHDGIWDGGSATVATGVADTTSNDGYINLPNGGGLSMDPASRNYDFEAWLDPANSTTRGLFGQIQALTSDDSEWWFRIDDASNLDYILRDNTGNQLSRQNISTGSLLTDAGFHHIVFEIDGGLQEVRTYVDSNLLDTSSPTTWWTGTIGVADERMVVGAYNTTPSSRFDGLADRYRISETSIPIPSTIALLAIGILIPAFTRRRTESQRKKRSLAKSDCS